MWTDYPFDSNMTTYVADFFLDFFLFLFLQGKTL